MQQTLKSNSSPTCYFVFINYNLFFIRNAGDMAFASVTPYDQYGNSINVMRKDVLNSYNLV